MAEGIRWAYNPPILKGISGAGAWPKSLSEMTRILSGLVGHGYNIASVNWRPPREWGRQQYLDVVRAAEQTGIQLMPWMGWAASSIAQVIGWIGESPSIWGWYSHDEPLAGGATKKSQRDVYNALKQYDPHTRPVVSCFTNARSEDWARAWAPETIDIGAMDIYPYAMSPDDPEYYLSYWANRLASYFINAGKQVIPMMQGYTHPGTPSPQIIPQWKWWNASQMPLYPSSYSVYGGEVHSQAEQLARLLGWEPPPPPPYDVTCGRCESLLRVQT